MSFSKVLMAAALLAMSVAGIALAQENPWDQQYDPETGKALPNPPSDPKIPAYDNDGKNEWPPGEPIPQKGNPPPMDSDFMISPAVSYHIRGGYAGTMDNTGYNNGGGIGAMVFMDGGRTGIMINAQVAGTEGGVFAYAEGDARLRYRIPIDPRHIVWGAFGLDISGRGAVDQRSESYFSAQLPVALIGTMFNVGGKCVIHVFAKAAFGIFDNQTQGDKWAASMDTFVKPAVGGEALAACGSIRVIADYQHIFSFGSFGDTDKASLQYSQSWEIGEKGWELGFFVKGGYVREGGMKDALPGDPLMDARHIGQVFGGLEVRWGARPTKIRHIND